VFCTVVLCRVRVVVLVVVVVAAAVVVAVVVVVVVVIVVIGRHRPLAVFIVATTVLCVVLA